VTSFTEHWLYHLSVFHSACPSLHAKTRVRYPTRRLGGLELQNLVE
jgi:hypothetical protein